MIFDEDDIAVDDRFLEVNPAYEVHSGLKDPSGMLVSELFPVLDNVWVETCAMVARTGEPARFEDYIPSVEKWFEATAFPVGEPGQALIALLFQDTTDSKHRELNAEFLAEISNDFSRLSGFNEIMETLSEKLARYLDVSRVTFAEVDEKAQTIEMSCDYHDPELADASGTYQLAEFMGKELVADLSCGAMVAIENLSTDPRSISRANSYEQFSVNSLIYAPYHRDGRWRFILSVFRSEERPWRQDEIDLMEELTARLWFRLERARDEEALLKADQRKNHFLAVLSHELRNPLASITLSLELLKRSRTGSVEEAKAREIIERQSSQLARLVDDLLDVTRITRDKFELQRQSLDLNEITQDTIKDHQNLFETNKISLTFEVLSEPAMIEGDRNRLAQVIGNLLQNAAKFSASGGHTQVAITADETSQLVELRITDEGAGIDAKTLSTLFEPFVQADATLDRSAGGLGLGLALVKGVVELHGGQVTAESEGPGEGASCAVRLPASSIKRQQTAVSEIKKGRKILRILLIEDNLDVIAGLKMLFEESGHQVEIATNGSSGLEMALAILPDAIICDIGLPGMDGFEVARAIRAAPTLQSTPLIALSGYARPEDVKTALTAGFDHHCAKPPDFEALNDLLYTSQNH